MQQDLEAPVLPSSMPPASPEAHCFRGHGDLSPPPYKWFSSLYWELIVHSAPPRPVVNNWPVLPMRQTGPKGGIAAKVALSFCLRVCTRISHGVPRADTGQCFPRDPEDVFKWDRASRGEDWPVTGQTAIKAEQLNSPSTELLLATLCPSWAHGRYWNIDVTDYLLFYVYVFLHL